MNKMASKPTLQVIYICITIVIQTLPKIGKHKYIFKSEATVKKQIKLMHHILDRQRVDTLTSARDRNK